MPYPPAIEKLLVQDALRHAAAGPSELRGWLKKKLAFAKSSNADGQTLYMQMLDRLANTSFNNRRVRNLALVARPDKWQWLCSGRDAAGRTLWPYILRAFDYRQAWTSLHSLTEATRAHAEGPLTDSAGCGLLEQTLLDASGAPYRNGGWNVSAMDLEHLGHRLPPLQAWVTDSPGHPSPALLAGIAGGSPVGARMGLFMLRTASTWHTQAEEVSPAWRSLFFNAALLIMVMDRAPCSDAERDLAAHEARAWLAPGLSIDKSVRTRIAQPTLLRKSAQIACSLVSDADTLSVAHGQSTRLAASSRNAARRLA